MAHLARVSLSTVCSINWNLEVLVFVEVGGGAELENQEKNPWSRGGNQQQTHPMLGAWSRIKPRHYIVEASVLANVLSLLPYFNLRLSELGGKLQPYFPGQFWFSTWEINLPFSLARWAKDQASCLTTKWLKEQTKTGKKNVRPTCSKGELEFKLFSSPEADTRSLKWVGRKYRKLEILC